MRGIDSLDVSAYRVELDAPESDGTLSWSATDLVVVEPRAEGITGLGFTYAPRAAASLIEDVLAPVVCGADPFDVPTAWSAMVAAIRNLGRPGISSMAIAAVDIALWDLKARLLAQPLYALLGSARSAVPIYGSGGFTSLSVAELVAQLDEWVHGQHIPRVKMKIGSGWGTRPAEDLERITAVRDAIGDQAELFVDANGAYSTKQAIHLTEAFAASGVTWFEEPVSSDDLAGLADIRAATDIEIAAGEYCYDLRYAERMAAAGAVDVLQADVSRCAGVSEWLRIAAVAASQGLQLSGHCAPALHLHPACAIPNLRHLEYFADHVEVEHRLFDGSVAPDRGELRPDPDRPGLGLELKRPDAERYRVG